ncbi:thiamine pyrophosphokinase [Pseudalgibacter alginicilyticus]|uniref:Thiamine diphosphokinase n=1 Tax=Pseudalgibacter alginicilyticus TaxID=1736674 RepID=A0A0N7HXY6_9FLAO|nr:thiamine diphosphokinase [Pseudalgibacter alginicilyticus]ALJ03758.1 thiamine pyrophosphokinase [Pseudalgibacter alginicilyticus]
MNLGKVFLLINGELPNTLPNMSEYDLICATDGAYQFLLENNITPDFISGDFDSLKVLPKNIDVIHTPNQDFTDFDKILNILFEKKFKSIDVYGASGKEQDHFLGNLSTAVHWKSKLAITFFDNYGHYFLAETITKLDNCKGKTISLVPFPEVKSVITKGLKYSLNKEDLFLGKRIGTRNEALSNDVVIEFLRGDLFVFVNN